MCLDMESGLSFHIKRTKNALIFFSHKIKRYVKPHHAKLKRKLLLINIKEFFFLTKPCESINICPTSKQQEPIRCLLHQLTHTLQFKTHRKVFQYVWLKENVKNETKIILSRLLHVLHPLQLIWFNIPGKTVLVTLFSQF